MERKWRLDDDLSVNDSVLDGFDFQQLITTVRCNSPKINEQAVWMAVKDTMDCLLQDMHFLVENNMDLIIKLAKEGKGDS